MLKRITALALVLVLALGMLPAAGALGREPIPQEPVDQCCHTLRVNTLSPDYVRPDFDGCLYEITPQRVEDHFRYLDEVYVERHPEAALVVNTGDRRDQEVLKTLAMSEKPAKLFVLFDELNENKSRTAIGRYKNINIRTV